MLQRKIAVLVMLAACIFIFFYLPYYLFNCFTTETKNAITPKNSQPNIIQMIASKTGIVQEVQTKTKLTWDGYIYSGYMSNNGLSVAVVYYKIADFGGAFSAPGVLGGKTTIAPNNRTKAPMLVYVLLRNDTEDIYIENISKMFKVVGKNEYKSNFEMEQSFRNTKPGSTEYTPSPVHIEPGETILTIVPFALDKGESFDNLKVIFEENLFTPTIEFDLVGKD